MLLTCQVLRDRLLEAVRAQMDSLLKVRGDESSDYQPPCTCSCSSNHAPSTYTHTHTHIQAVEAVSLLDMLTGFAELVLSEDNYWTRPALCLDPDAALAIKAGRHPVVEKHVVPFVPNNAFASRFANLVLVSGANGAGKSIYCKQLSLIAVLAQIGCFVPAESASLPIFDRILTSLGTGDDMVGVFSMRACVCVVFFVEID